MALFSVDFYSKSLFRPVNFKLFVPNDVPPEMKMGNTYYERPTKILVLLHGYNGGNLDWALYSNASEISSKYNLAVILPSGENSFYLDSEATGHKYISDDEYFSQMVRDDLNLIIRDIREAHKKDSESAPQTTVADELKENLEAVENFKGSRDEKLVVLYCKQLGINYKNLSDEEFRWLIRILKKSKKMGTPINQRKKR